MCTIFDYVLTSPFHPKPWYIMVNNSTTLMFSESVPFTPNNLILAFNQQTNPPPHCMDEATFQHNIFYSRLLCCPLNLKFLNGIIRILKLFPIKIQLSSLQSLVSLGVGQLQPHLGQLNQLGHPTLEIWKLQLLVDSL
jgi:hypothetical protein